MIYLTTLRMTRLLLAVWSFVTLVAPEPVEAAAPLDTLVLGQSESESAHQLVAARSETVTGGLGEPARRLLPGGAHEWEGGTLHFTMAVSPDQPNYATIKLWGSDVTRDQLILFCAGKQIGYRHLGDVDILDIGGGTAAFKDRFYYNTTPLPLELTRGRTNLDFEIRCIGPTFAYASEFEKYQKPMTEPTRGIYRFYTHTDGAFELSAAERQGTAVTNPPVRTDPGEEVLAELKARVNGELKKLITSKTPLNQMQMQFLARAYHVKWSVANHNPQALTQLVNSLDAIYAAYQKNPKLAEEDPATWNASWFGLGPSGDVLRLLADEIKPLLDAPVAGVADGKLSRRKAYAEMLVACRDWHRQHRRLYTNQTMISDVYGIYLANRGLEVVAPEQALSEPEVRRYLYESVGLEPWRDSDGKPDWNVGTNYWQLTAKALTKELGYVGYYGEVLDWMTTIYEATRPALDQPGDARIGAQLVRAAHVRGVFRYPGVDDEGYRAMRIEAMVGWRDGGHYPGDIAYAERMTWDGSALGWVAATLDPEGLGYVQQMLADHQFFGPLREHLKAAPFRTVASLLPVPDQYDLIQAQPPQTARLPMSPGHPDFVFSDEGDGVVAIKHGDELLYASLYWRARNAVNSLARVHFTTPTVDRIAVVHELAQFEADGRFYTRPDHINFGFANGGPKYPAEIHSALAGEKLPIAKIPAGVNFKPGDESVYAGKAEFYTLRYGRYLIAMNLSPEKTFTVETPAGVSEAPELVSGKTVKLTTPLTIAPRSTMVLYLPVN